MPNDENSLDPYEAVLRDLRAQRDQIDQTIASLERLRGLKGGVSAIQATLENAQGSQSSVVEAGEFFGMTLADAAKKLLAKSKKNLTNSEIIEGLERGGMIMRSDNKVNTINSTLTRRFQQIGDIVKVKRGIWGLKDWHPNLRYKTTKNGDDTVSANNDTVSES